MEAIITAATVLTMYFNAVNSDNANYMYNGEMEDGVVNKIEVYAQNDRHQMEQKMEYCYAYDEQGRLTTREVVRWDENKQDWVNDFRHTYKYYKNGYNMETSKWDVARQTYDIPSEVTLYREVAPTVTSVRTYRMNEAKDNMYLTNSLLCMESLDQISDKLMAIK
jgi:hypothetical protein